MKWYKDKIFWFIFTAAALFKLATLAHVYFVNPLGEQALIFPDSLGYIYPAQTLLTYGQLWEAVSAAPLLMRTPGYPVFLALVQMLTHSSTWGVVIVQNLLSLFLLLPVYLTAFRLGDKTAARWAAGFCAASVLYFSLSFAVLTEMLCVFLLAWFVFFAVRWLQTTRRGDLLAAALLLAAAVYVRPAVYYFVPVSFVLAGAFAAYQKSRTLAKQAALFLLLPSVLFIGAWQLRNYVKTGYSGFTTVGAYNLYVWNADYVAKQIHVTVSQAHQLLLSFLPSDFNSRPVSAQVREYKRLAAPLLKKGKWHKLTHFPVWAGKTLLGPNHVHLARLLLGRTENDRAEQTLNQTGLVSTLNLPKVLFLLAVGQVFSVVILGIWGLFILWKTHRAAALLLAVYSCYFWGIGSCFFGAYARFRAPFEFVLCLTAGLAVSSLWNRRKQN